MNVVDTTLNGQSGTGKFVGDTSPTITTPKIAQINDTIQNLPVVSLQSPASSVNYLDIQANLTGELPRINAVGTDTNIGINFVPKGTGGIQVSTQSTNTVFALYSGSGYQHLSMMNFPSSANVTTYTFPDLTGTVALSGAAQDVTFNSVSWSDTTKGIVGTTTNNSASAGYVGEYVSSTNSSGTSISNGIDTNITSITLTAGDWNVFGNITVVGTGVVLSYISGWTSTTSATQPTVANYNGIALPTNTASTIGAAAPPLRLSLSGTTTVYLSTRVGTTGTATGYGVIWARRAR